MKIRILLALVIVAVTLASCGGLRNKSKAREEIKIEELSKRDCVLVDKSISSGEVKETIQDKGLTVTEKETTTITEKGGKTKVEIKKDDLKPGTNYLRDSAGNEVKAILDTLNKTLSLELVVPTERITKTEKERKTEQADKTSQREDKKQEQLNKQVAVTNQEKRIAEFKTSSSESKVDRWAVFIDKIGWAVAFLVVIGVLFCYFGVKRRK